MVPNKNHASFCQKDTGAFRLGLINLQKRQCGYSNCIYVSVSMFHSSLYSRNKLFFFPQHILFCCFLESFCDVELLGIFADETAI